MAELWTLVLVAHGSSKDPGVADQVRDAARGLACDPDVAARFAAVEVAFLKQSPNVGEVARGRDVVILPLFMAEGYFVNEVLPREIAAGPPRLAITLPPLGADPRLLDVVETTDRAVVIVGHGTPRDSHSRASVEAAVQRLRSERRLDAYAAFLDDEPGLADVARDLCSRSPVTVIPWFATAGPHVDHDIVEPMHALGGDIVVEAPAGTTRTALRVMAAMALEASLESV